MTPTRDRSALFKLLADPTREQMLALLDVPRTVGELATLMGCEGHKLHHHIDVLSDAELIKCVETRMDKRPPERVWQLVDPAGGGGALCPPGYVPVLNRASVAMMEQVLVDFRAVVGSLAEAAPARALVFQFRAEDRPDVRAVIKRHMAAMREELADLESADGDPYVVFSLHYPAPQPPNSGPAEEASS